MRLGAKIIDAASAASGSVSWTLAAGETRVRVSWKASGVATVVPTITGLVADGDSGQSLFTASGANSHGTIVDVRGLRSITIGYNTLSAGTITVYAAACGEDGF